MPPKVNMLLSKQPVEKEGNAAREEQLQLLACAWSKINVAVPLAVVSRTYSFHSYATVVVVGQPFRC